MITRFLQTPFAILAAILCLAGLAVSQARDNELRMELLAMRNRDQKAREDCPTGNQDEQMKCSDTECGPFHRRDRDAEDLRNSLTSAPLR